MITRSQALALAYAELGTTNRYGHSLAVAKRMEDMASAFKSDAEEWYLTGLLHDIDLERTKNEMSRHGVLAQSMLKGMLPTQALLAIEAHDQRTGVRSDTYIAQALRFADIVDNLIPRIGLDVLKTAADAGEWKTLIDGHPDIEDRLRAVEDFMKRWPSVTM
jgi:putative nucleotidyltransferase with HDIG domain